MHFGGCSYIFKGVIGEKRFARNDGVEMHDEVKVLNARQVCHGEVGRCQKSIKSN